MKILVLDVETDTHNKGHPHDPRNICVSYGIYTPECSRIFKYYTDPDFIGSLNEALGNCDVLVGFNLKFDIQWLTVLGVTVPPGIRIWDCQLAEHVFNGQKFPYDSLDAALARWGLPAKKKHVVHDYWAAGIQTRDIPKHILQDYNIGDIDVTRLLFEMEQDALEDNQKNLVWIEGEDLRTLVAAECAGTKFDAEGAKALIEQYKADIVDCEQRLMARLPDGIPAGMFNYDSGDDLSAFLYGGIREYDYVSHQTLFKSGAKAGQPRNHWAVARVQFPRIFNPLEDSELKKTKGDTNAETRYYSTDQSILAQLKCGNSKAKKAVLQDIGDRSKKIKVVEMLESILELFETKQWKDSIIHGQFNQVVAITGRLSSSAPNMQNTPPEVDKFLVSRYED